MAARRERTGNVGAALGALLPLIAGGAVLLQNPMQMPVVAPSPLGTAQAPAPRAAPPIAAAGPAAAPVPVPPDSATPECLARLGGVDLPVRLGDVPRREMLICRRGYVLALNVDTRDPAWVMERLAPGDLTGKADRDRSHFAQDAVARGADASDQDYDNSGFDRGHQAPAGDAKFDQTVMNQSFFFTNMAPQQGLGFNRGAWAFLEESVRAWVVCGGHSDLYVFTGPIQDSRRGVIGADRVAVPGAFFKIVFDPNSGRTVGFVLPNQKIGSRIPDLQAYVKPIAAIETDTGLTFFHGFDQRRQSQLKDEPGTAWAHIATCPG